MEKQRVRDRSGCGRRPISSALFVLIVALASTNARAELPLEARAKIPALARSQMWLRLLHYKPTFPFGTVKSRVDGPGFFFSPEGKSNPEAELLATAEAFYKKDLRLGRLKQKPQCAFPVRFQFLNEALGLKLPDINQTDCPDYEALIAGFRAQSATLVFSSAYSGSPASMFGHTFLKIESDRHSDLLDWGISYAANVPRDENAFAFMYFGLTGGYPGQFSLRPYYVKVNEYINAESRDLWEYELNLTRQETIRLISHIWELESNSWLDYYFFDENCSYELLAALEVAKPEWNLTDGWLFVIPAETVKRMASVPGAIRNVRYRPSLRKKLSQKFALLSADQRDAFSSIRSGKMDPEKIGDPLVLETAALYYEYVRQRDEKLAPDQQEVLRKALLKRSSIPGVPKATSAYAEPGPDHPEWGHGPSRLGVSSGMQMDYSGHQNSFQELSFKFAYHDLLNNDLGYLPSSQVDFPWITLRYVPETSQLSLERLDALTITSLSPLSFIEKKVSWKVNLDYYSPKDFGCLTCHAGRAEAGMGATVELFSPKYLAYFLGEANLEVGDGGLGFRWGPKGQLGLLFNPWTPYKLNLVGSLVSDLSQSLRQPYFTEVDFDQSISLSRSFELRTGILYLFASNSALAGGANYAEGKLSFNFYF